MDVAVAVCVLPSHRRLNRAERGWSSNGRRLACSSRPPVSFCAIAAAHGPSTGEDEWHGRGEGAGVGPEPLTRWEGGWSSCAAFP
jgi:hypothetical protein